MNESPLTDSEKHWLVECLDCSFIGKYRYEEAQETAKTHVKRKNHEVQVTRFYTSVKTTKKIGDPKKNNENKEHSSGEIKTDELLDDLSNLIGLNESDFSISDNKKSAIQKSGYYKICEYLKKRKTEFDRLRIKQELEDTTTNEILEEIQNIVGLKNQHLTKGTSGLNKRGVKEVLERIEEMKGLKK
ncbi:hypothetical protein [Methanonatronarchaeum sp. AMET6-2]|uniref:hypothetical protein n=1 Tax=Methanonatronarchaeum sp. AMET6-2 TaxID=2933293 RepID=UPI001FF510C3|nr:hypothetical protein [Methanonatronarchaeum sp. AMET6-2]UOY10009.1 hypothetical protein MU439_07050 [Methanonatronarchaeum sp. AMET6-2]